MPVARSGVMLGVKIGPNGVSIFRPPASGSPPGAVWQATLIGRDEIWPVHQKTAELGGMLRTGLEDSFYLPGGERASGNGVMIEALAKCAERAGRTIAAPARARQLLGLADR